MSSVVTDNKKIQGTPPTSFDQAKLAGGKTIYCLTYKDHKVDYEYFVAEDQKAAEALGRKYCEVFKKRFIWVGPWLRDLASIIETKLAENPS